MYLKPILLWCFVYLWAPLRNAVRNVCGCAHTTILVYHRVSNDDQSAMSVRSDQFVEQLEELSRHYEVIDLATFVSRRGRRLTHPAVVLTFDDGYEDNFSAARLLYERQLPCTFFVSTQLVGTSTGFPHDVCSTGKRIPTLSWDQLRQMADWGFDISNHTTQHVDLGAVSLEEAAAAVVDAISDLRREIGEPARLSWLAYPFGQQHHISERVRERLPQLGIEYCLSAYGGTNSPTFAAMDIRRQGVNHCFSSLAFRAAIEGWRCREVRSEPIISAGRLQRAISRMRRSTRAPSIARCTIESK
jgi:peptidoglycan/xylan/chitin deacetylase (PgdA/CDA1 family)